MTIVDKKYSTYNHVSNGGISLAVVLYGEEDNYSQLLDIEISNFGIYLKSSLYLDDNVIDALQVILDKAKLQRKYYKMSEYDAVNKTEIL